MKKSKNNDYAFTTEESSQNIAILSEILLYIKFEIVLLALQ